MQVVLLVIHLMIALSLIGVILLQKSEGGGMSGLTGGGTMGGFMTARGSTNLLTRVTAGLAVAFVTTSILLAILVARDLNQGSFLDQQAVPKAPETQVPAAPSVPDTK